MFSGIWYSFKLIRSYANAFFFKFIGRINAIFAVRLQNLTIFTKKIFHECPIPMSILNLQSKPNFLSNRLKNHETLLIFHVSLLNYFIFLLKYQPTEYSIYFVEITVEIPKRTNIFHQNFVKVNLFQLLNSGAEQFKSSSYFQF